ncbi:hypothetical protein DFA_08296 [Cavenderia fasciculata]|uniref:Type I phosphodiesterase/nucleotide pyrophosphatase family protein n=1 Tax=Cavenderia fasciculata TaxID=261658 RepID=F4Q5P4_CACFS|nr:uncharacterized protein DFA_08296 [Cavenderia fasciculata]EGG17303.1 hypothetical protein DFA_08296 [Cavenderia fasciculata]|eukprot:XP_004355787.1 hypothetical protein DFA_08296 [Cavenderia fasciculata]
MIKSIIIFMVLAITLSVATSEFAYYVDRSADIIIEPKQHTVSSTTNNKDNNNNDKQEEEEEEEEGIDRVQIIDFIDKKRDGYSCLIRFYSFFFSSPKHFNSLLYLKGNIFNSVNFDKIKDTQISTLISHVMGTLPLNNEDRTGFPQVSLFNKPKLNLFFALDSVSKENLKSLTFLNGESVQIEKNFYPMDSVSELTTIFSGVTPSEHGIVGANWENKYAEKVESFSRGHLSSKINLADVQDRTFQGKSIIVSSSSNKQLAGAITAHPKPAQPFLGADARTVETLLYSREFRQFVLPEGWRAVLTSGSLKITTAAGESVTVDIDAEPFDSLLTELAVVFNTVKALGSKDYSEAVNDAIPDLVSFAFGSLKSVDRQGEFFTIALAMIDRAMQSSYDQLSGLYSNRIACEVVVLNGGETIVDKETVDQINIVVGKHTYSSRIVSSPSIYLRPSSKNQREEICDQLIASVDNTKFNVHCATKNSVLIRAQPANLGEDGSSSDASNESPAQSYADMIVSNQVAAFQIFLFFPIVWVLFIAGGFLLTMGISTDAQKDTLLYRNTGRNH